MLGPYVVHLEGALDADRRDALHKELATAEQIGGIVVIDLRNVGAVDAAAIAALANTRDRLRAAHGQLRLVVDDRALEAQLHAAPGGHPKFDVYGSLEAAALDC